MDPGASRFLIDPQGVEGRVDAELVHGHLARSEFFWLDLFRPQAEDVALLQDVFGFHPLAVEDAAHFGQRPKLDEYEGYVLLVVYGANEDVDGLVEVHCFVSDRFLVTVHRDDCPPFEELRRRPGFDAFPGPRAAVVLHAVVDALVDSFFPELTRIDDRIDELERAVLARPGDAHREEIFRLQRRLVTLRKIVTGQRDVFMRLMGGVVSVPGMSGDVQRYYRDVYDHLLRISDLIDSHRDLLSNAMELHLSNMSNRLNEVMKRLTVVATIFMPLTWITGFFGMNFEALVRGVAGWPAFVALGIATQVVAVAVMLTLFHRRGWM